MYSYREAVLQCQVSADNQQNYTMPKVSFHIWLIWLSCKLSGSILIKKTTRRCDQLTKN